MRLFQAFLSVTALVGLAQSLSLPVLDSGLESKSNTRSVPDELDTIIKRAGTCSSKNPKECTICARPQFVKKGASKPRSLDSEEPSKTAHLIPRKTHVAIMDSIIFGAWEEGDMLFSEGFSACSAMVVYNEKGFVFTHIPPIRAANGQVFTPSEEMVRNYLGSMTKKYDEQGKLPRAKGYLLVSDMMDPTLKSEMEAWYASRGINMDGNINVYHHDTKSNKNKSVLRIVYDKGHWPPVPFFLSQ